MRTHLVLLVVFLAAFAAPASPALGQSRIERRFPVDRDAYIKVYMLEGSVTVAGWEKDSIAVTGTIERGRLFSGGKGKSAKLGLWEDQDQESGRGRIEVRVPATATIWIKSAAAAVTVTGMTGGVDANSVTGDIRIGGSPGQIYAESMGGDIRIDASGSSIRARTAGGSVVFRGRAEDLLLSTVSGSIDATTIAPLRARLETVTGPIRWEGGVERGGSLDFQTHSGTVELSLPTDLDAEISAATIKGAISGTPLSAGASSAARDRSGLDVMAGAGGAQITVHTFSGDIEFLAR